MDIGFHNCVARALMMHISAEENVRRSLQVGWEGKEMEAERKECALIDRNWSALLCAGQRRRYEQVFE